MAEPLESRVTPTERKQVSSCVGEIGEDVHLQKGLVKNVKNERKSMWGLVIITSISSERERREATGSVPMARAISVRLGKLNFLLFIGYMAVSVRVG